MTKKKRRSLLAVVVAGSMVLVLLIGYWRPYVRVSVQKGLVGPDSRAYELLQSGAPLEEIQSAVKASGKPVDKIAWRGVTLLSEAVWGQRYDLVAWLLKQGAAPNGVYVNDVPLNHAIMKEDVRMVELLLEHGADPTVQGRGLGSPIEVALRTDNEKIIRAIKEHINPDTRSGEPAEGVMNTEAE